MSSGTTPGGSAPACALGRSGKTCLLEGEIEQLVTIYNSKIAKDGDKIDTKRITKTDILDLLERKVKCSDEACTVGKILAGVRGTPYESTVMRIRDIAFQASGPYDLDALLDNFLIIRICRQMESNYSGVKFAGVVTADFMMPPPTTMFGDAKEVWKDYAEHKWKQLHFVLNTDHRMGEGIHWTSFIIDAENGEIQYFDSYGLPPFDGKLRGTTVVKGLTDASGTFTSLMRNWINDVRTEFIKHGHPMKFVQNMTRHQAPGDMSNCGPYAVLFLSLRAKGKSFGEITGRQITTEEITKLRSYLYHRDKDYQPSLPLI